MSLHPTVMFVAGLHRQVLYGGLRIGMYDPLKRAFMGSKAAATDVPGLHIKIAAGMTSGALAILVASPTDLVKVCLWLARVGVESQLCFAPYAN